MSKMYPKGCVYILCAACVVIGAMASSNVAVFFPEIKGNLSSITWAHAVNNQSYLNSTLYDNDIMMIEADIILGRWTGANATNSTQIPVMGHPPSNSSDLTLETFLTTISTHNTNASSNRTTRKGVKLDFKSIEVFNASLSILTKFNQGNFPLWLNADILKGPINATTVPVNPTQFLQWAAPFNNSVLSIGWTTDLGNNATGSYSTDQINSMINITRENNVTQDITFPVRAGLAAESLAGLRTLVTNVTGSTLTIWSSEGDRVNVANLRTLIANITVQRVFIDVPESLRSQLRLGNLPSPNSGNTLMPKIVIAALVALIAMLFKEL